jgi:hypothetical protein
MAEAGVAGIPHTVRILPRNQPPELNPDRWLALRKLVFKTGFSV